MSFSNTAGQVAIINYKVKFTNPGKYFVWVRAHSTGSEDNGVHVGIDGAWPASGQRMQWCSGKNQWTWESKQRTGANHCGEPEKIFINVPTAGVHTISFSMREDGFEMDKFVLSKVYTKPTGTGPAEVLVDCGENDNKVYSNTLKETKIKVYPNPANDFIQIAGTQEGDEIIIYDLNGRKIYHTKTNSNIKHMDISRLKRGIYIISISGKDKIQFIKQ